MANKNKNRNQNRTPTPNRTPAATAAPARPEPTSEQIERLDAVASQVEALSAEHGPPSTEGVAEQVGATLEENLKRVEGLLNSARGHFDRARELETAGKAEEKRLADQKRDQEAALRQKKKEADTEIETSTRPSSTCSRVSRASTSARRA
jgi:hypothetical protein